MATINFTYALKRFFPELKSQDIDGKSVKEILDILEQRFPGMRGYILDDQGRLREHVNIFLNGELIKDKFCQSDVVGTTDEIFIMQALSGGRGILNS
ncbi:MAG TPA: MoaD/ThiS family protein [Saprospiraceae bacterium]|nr:MoaD/ThiS family protein [Saprospiraceae bacterium]